MKFVDPNVKMQQVLDLGNPAFHIIKCYKCTEKICTTTEVDGHHGDGRMKGLIRKEH